MERLKLAVCLVLLCTLTNPIFSQTADRSESQFQHLFTATDLTEITPNDASFYVDEDQTTYYIDFEAINVNLSQIIVRNDQNEIVFTDKVFDLPVDTIYELDFEPLGKGTFHIELKSYTTIIKKQVDIL